MKRNTMIKILITIIISLTSLNLCAQDYYWSNKTKHFLSNSTSGLFVVSSELPVDSFLISATTNYVVDIGNLKIISSQLSLDDLKSIIGSNNIIRTRMFNDIEMLFNGEILLKPKTNVSISRIIQACNNEIVVKEKSKYNTYVMAVLNWDSLFVYANKLYESNMVEYSHPNFIIPLEQFSDTLYKNQYYLSNENGVDINVSKAWEIATNKYPVKVAVIDDGVEQHEDMGNRVMIGFTPSVSSNNPNTYGKPNSNDPPNYKFGHGQACAGIIGAEHNNIGIKGICETARIIPINIFNNWYLNPYGTLYYMENANDLARAIDKAWDDFGADVLSNSWGYGTSNSELIPSADAIISAINRARIMGRNGKGSVVVFASGNSSQNVNGVCFPGNVQGVLTVGAIDRNGNIQSYSKRGSEMDVVAPSGNCNLQGDVATTDRMGIKGYETGNYTLRFGGTSAACPQVSGVVALMLSENPNLTEVQIKNILHNTAKDLGVNGFDFTYGYGLVDAYAAVQKAKDMDLYIRDVETDNGVEPSNTNGCMWNSPDIWIEDFDNNVVDNPRGGEEYYVCVRVHNNKNIPSTGTEKLYLNWAKAGTDLRWRSSWDGEHFFNCDREVHKGDVIDEDVPIPSIAANSSTVVRVPWVVPVAERYMSCSEFDSELWHFCLVARVHDGNEIVNEDDENGDMAYFVERNNNVAWKNLSVLSSYSKGAVVSVSNPFREKRFFRLTYKSDLNKAGEPLEKFADVYLMLDEGLLDAWKVSGCKGSGFKQVSDNMFLMTDREVVLDNLYLNPDEHHTIQTDVCFFTQSVPQDSVFDFDIALYYWDKELQIIGGEHYMAIKNMDRDFKALALNDTSVLMSQIVNFSAVNINEPAQYTWYDVNGDTVGTGMNLTVQPMTSQQYKLEVVAEADGAKDYDTVSVAVRGGMLVSLSPNPANDRIDVEYRLADNVSNALIQIVSSTGIIVNTIPITNTQTSITINIQALASGSYSVGLLLPNGEMLDMKTLIVR